MRRLNVSQAKSTIISISPSLILVSGLAALAYFGNKMMGKKVYLKDESVEDLEIPITNVQQKLQDDKDFMETVTNLFLIENKDMNDFMHSILEKSLQSPTLSFIYGEKGIGKTTSIQRELDKMKNTQFLYITKGIEELTIKMVPDYKKEYSVNSMEKVLHDALMDYSNFRSEMKQKEPETFKNKAIIIFDNSENILNFQPFLDHFKEISFVFLSNKFPKNLPKQIELKIMTEPSYALDYFERIGVPEDYFVDLVKITGNCFKYLLKVQNINKTLPREEFFKSVKAEVFSEIQKEISEDLKNPKVMKLCEEIISQGNVTMTKDEVDFGNVFLLEDEKIKFQNSAKENYIKNHYFKKQ
jgi:hypothetical protein